jgi:putative PIN family toxin of toxin-antitoxin system
MPGVLTAIVLDTNVYVQYFLNPKGVAAKCLAAVEDRKARLFISRDVLTEVRDVLLRPKILSRLPADSSLQVELFLRYVTEISTLFDPISPQFLFDRDPKDQMFIDLAIETGADFLVTRDKDMLDLMTGHSDQCKEFRQRFRGLKIVEPVEFLAQLDQSRQA